MVRPLRARPRINCINYNMRVSSKGGLNLIRLLRATGNGTGRMQTQILGLLTPLMALFFAATFAAFWRIGGLKRHVLGFAIGYLFFATGFLVTHFLPADASYVFHTTQAFYTLGVVFFLGSVCERVGQRHPPPGRGRPRGPVQLRPLSQRRHLQVITKISLKRAFFADTFSCNCCWKCLSSVLLML